MLGSIINSLRNMSKIDLVGHVSVLGTGICGYVSHYYSELSKDAAAGGAKISEAINNYFTIDPNNLPDSHPQKIYLQRLATLGSNGKIFTVLAEQQQIFSDASKLRRTAEDSSKMWGESSEFYWNSFLICGTAYSAFLIYKCLTMPRNRA